MGSSRRAGPTVSSALLVLLSGTVLSAQSTLATTPPANQSQADNAPCDRQGFATLFRCPGHDLRNVVRGDSLVWLGAGALLTGGSILLDDEVKKSMTDADPDQSLAAGEVLGHADLQFGLPVTLYAVARATKHQGTADFAITLLRTQVINGMLTRGLKLIPRPRPNQEVATLTKGSFPSGHTSAMFATATVVQRRWGWHGGLPAYLVATYVGATRLQNMHYLSDVAFGAALGIATGLVVNLPSRHAAISPIVAPGLTAVQVDLNLSRAAGP